MFKVTGCVSVATFASLACVPVGITSSVIRRKICAITAWIKKCKSIRKKKRKNHEKIVLLRKDRLNTIEVVIAKALILKRLRNILYKNNGNLLS